MAVPSEPSAIASAQSVFAELVRDPLGAAVAWVGQNWPSLALGLGASIITYLLLRGILAGVRKAAGKLGGGDYSTGDIVRRVLAATSALSLLLFAGVVGVNLATSNPRFQDLSGRVLALIGIFQLALYVRALLLAIVHREAAKASSPRSGFRSGLSILVWFVNTLVLSIGLLLILDNVGVNVTALVAGLGVGGIAIGLAAQGIFKDLFSALSILFDKPFELGDFVIVGSFMGTIEQIGLKTTRLRALSGEQVIIGNAALLDERIQNMGRMQERRVPFTLGLTYQMSAEQLRTAKTIVTEIINNTPNARFERAHLFRLGPSSLDFEVIFWVTSPDYLLYMDVQEQVYLKLVERFRAAGLEFAYPTQTVFNETVSPQSTEELVKRLRRPTASEDGKRDDVAAVRR